MNWGYGITMVIVTFMLFILTLSYFMVMSNDDSIVKDYYEKDIHYQKTIEAKKNASYLKEKLQLDFDAQKQIILIQVPKELFRVIGKIYFMKPNKVSKDFQVTLQLDSAYQQVIKTEALEKGLWNIEMEFESEGKNYKSQVWSLNF
jgi:nitrogen fixation protein FixH